MLLEKISQVINATPLADFRQKRTLTAFKNILGRAIVTQKEFEYLRNFLEKFCKFMKTPIYMKLFMKMRHLNKLNNLKE